MDGSEACVVNDNNLTRIISCTQSTKIPIHWFLCGALFIKSCQHPKPTFLFFVFFQTIFIIFYMIPTLAFKCRSSSDVQKFQFNERDTF